MPHIFQVGGDAAPVLRHINVADVFDDVFDQNDSPEMRYIVRPLRSPARVHQRLDVGAGQLGLDATFGTLAEVEFDGIITSCVFSEERRAVNSVHHMHRAITSLTERSGLVTK